MTRKLSVALIVAMLLALCAGARADTEIAVENGYALTLPDGWIAGEPSEIAARDVHGSERAAQTLYPGSVEAGGYRIDVYVGEGDQLTGVDLASFRGRVKTYEMMRDYFQSFTDDFWILGCISADSEIELCMNYVDNPGDEYLMAFTFKDNRYTGFVFYNIGGDLKTTIPLTDADYDWFEAVMKGLREC